MFHRGFTFQLLANGQCQRRLRESEAARRGRLLPPPRLPEGADNYLFTTLQTI